MTRTGLFVLSAVIAACTGPSSAPPAAPAPARPAGSPAAASDRPPATSPARPDFRLGDAVRPLRYALDLTLVPDRDRFSGVVDVEVALAERTSTILLHGDGLTVESASVSAGTDEVAARAVPIPPDFIAFELARPVDPGSAHLRIRYSAPLRPGESDGLYSEVEGGDRYIYTQFEASDARRAFPSFDEPRFKVPWTISLHVKKEHVALANSPAVSEADEPDGMKVVRFAESKPMPSYLVALAVGPFDVVDAGVAGRNKTKIRIIATRGRAADARWAVQSTGPILEELEAYFDIPYPYEKLDSIAVPQKGGAMENPGLITYGSNLILARAGDDTVARRRGYAGICAHELAHMWFGDLVTMAWWDDLWLNEAFATWMARRTIDGWKPGWGGEGTRVADRWTAMSADSLVSARKIRQPIGSQDDIESAFDRITYDKGAAVIVMFERWLGREPFQRGVRRYLKQFAWKNATAADFLAAISAEAGRDVAPAFSTFLDQPGVPLVSAALNCPAGGPPVVSLSQARSLPAGSPGGADGLLWQLPVCVRHPQGVECTLLSEAKAEMPLAGAKGCPAWLLANAGMNGYYRVHYQGDLWARLGRAWKKLSVPERVGLFGDLRALVVGGQVKIGDALAQLEPRVAGAERHQLVAMIGIASVPHELLPGEGLRPVYAGWIRKTFGRRARALGWRVRAGEKEDQRLLRPKLVALVAKEGEDRALIGEAGRLARRWLDDRSAVNPDVLEEVLVVAAQNGDRALFDRMHAAARKSDDRKERGRLLKAMGSFRDPAALRAALEVVLSRDFDPRQVASIYEAALEDPRTRDAAWAFVSENVDRIAERLPRNSRRRLVSIGAHFCDPDHRAAVDKLFAGRGQSERASAQTLEKIDLCSAQRELHAASLRGFLAGERAPRDVARPPAGARKTRSGLYFKVLKRGTGKLHPKASSKVEVHYSGWTTDGVMFDSSRQRGQPATFPLDGVIPGWTEGVQLMVEGERARLWIPEPLAYKGAPGRPAGMLVFDVELLRIVD